MITIHKFEIVFNDRSTIHIPGFIKVLSVVEQYDDIVLYAEVNTEDTVRYKIDIAIAGTGHNIEKLDSDFKFYNTIKTENGKLMWHVYVKAPDE